MVRRTFSKILLAAVAVVFGLLALSGILWAQGRSDQAFERVAEVQERHSETLMARPGVVGTAVGLDDDGGHVVLVLLENPGVGGIPDELEGVPVRVMVTGQIHARADRPAPIGVSTGHPAITAGTIGCRVTDGTNVYALSNNHVYANANDASIGDAVIQPGTYDGGSLPDDRIGDLADFEPIEFSRRARNTMDAAIAISNVNLLGNATPAGGYGLPASQDVSAFLGELVQKFGRTTGWTQGHITALNATVNVSYGPGKTARFVDQIVIEPGDFSAGGDSGSLIVTDYPDDPANDKRPVGLLFAGSSSHTIANRIDLVLDRFGVTIDGETAGAAGNDIPVVSISSPADGATFDSGFVISFAASATDTEDGDITGDLVWTSDKVGQIGTGGSFQATLSDGVHEITAAAADSGGKVGTATISITVGTPPPGPAGVSVNSITYATEGGKNADKHLLVTVALVDDLGSPVGGASVSISLSRDGSPVGSATGTTAGNGQASFTLKNAQSGTYTSTITNVAAAGLVWDGITPANSFTK